MKKLYLAAAVLCAVLGLFCLGQVFTYYDNTPIQKPSTEPPEQSIVEIPQEKKPEQAETVEEESYVSPIDFVELQKTNPHIYAWLDIPEAETSYPVLQHPEDDSFYLDKDLDGNYRQAGSLFTERQYNSTDFNDPVTIIYGHYMKSGAMFGNLQQFYSNPQNFAENNKITVFLPDRELTYQVFAATQYDNRHILDNYDFSDAEMFELYFDHIFSIRSMNTNIDHKINLDSSDKVLILSTCLKGDYSQRYLVFAKLV